MERMRARMSALNEGIKYTRISLKMGSIENEVAPVTEVEDELIMTGGRHQVQELGLMEDAH